MKITKSIKLLILTITILFPNIVMAADYVPETVKVEKENVLVKPLKKIKKIKKIKKTNQTQEAEVTQQQYSSSEIVIDSDFMEYYPERSEIEAIGNAKVTLEKDNTTIYANRIVFNHDLNNIKAYDDVKIVNSDSTTIGDFINLDLNQENGWIDKPITENYAIKISSKEGYIYSDRIEEYDGVAKIIKDQKIKFGSNSLATLVNPGNPSLSSAYSVKDSENAESGVYKIKARTIYIDSQEQHNVLKMDNVDIYLKNIKIASVPTLTTVSNKEQHLLDTNLPEMGQVSQLGMYVGPGFVFNLPRASTLKVIPILNYKDDFGIGGIARFRNSRNITEIAYGSAKDVFLIRGKHNITDNLELDYNQNTLMDEWFLGARRPRYGTQLQYKKSYRIDDLNAVYSQRFSGGYFADYGHQVGDGEARVRWQAQIHKPLYSYENPNGDLSINVSVLGQTSMSLYTTGDNIGIVRIGPMLSTNFKRWSQDLIYYQSAVAGQTPFAFDRYAYGKSNLVLIEKVKLHKYVSIGYLASMALLKDNYENKMLQESRLLLSLGPEYAQIILGYDAKRKNTMMLFAMQVGTKDSDIKFKKAVLKNPDNMSKKVEPLFDFSKVKYYRDKIFSPPVEDNKPVQDGFDTDSANPLQYDPLNDKIPAIQPMLMPQQWIR